MSRAGAAALPKDRADLVGQAWTEAAQLYSQEVIARLYSRGQPSLLQPHSLPLRPVLAPCLSSVPLSSSGNLPSAAPGPPPPPLLQHPDPSSVTRGAEGAVLQTVEGRPICGLGVSQAMVGLARAAIQSYIAASHQRQKELQQQQQRQQEQPQQQWRQRRILPEQQQQQEQEEQQERVEHQQKEHPESPGAPGEPSVQGAPSTAEAEGTSAAGQAQLDGCKPVASMQPMAQDNGAVDGGTDGLAETGDGATGAGSKRCNCKKARCLKLYCVCFAAGVYCSSCACRECLNTPENQDLVLVERSKKLAASPGAFAPKVEVTAEGEMACHKKGCRCRRSRCVKKYCECFDAQVFCSASCKCDACLNMPGLLPPDVELAPRIRSSGSGWGAQVSGTGAGAGNEMARGAGKVAAAETDNSANVQAHPAGGQITPPPDIAPMGHGSLSFAVAPGTGPFLLSLHSGLSFLDGRGVPVLMFRGPEHEATMEGKGLTGPTTDGAPAKGPVKMTVPDGAVQVPSDKGVGPQAMKPIDRRPSASARMFAEADAVLDAEVLPGPAPARVDQTAGVALQAAACSTAAAAAAADPSMAGPGGNGPSVCVAAAVGPVPELQVQPFPDQTAGSSARGSRDDGVCTTGAGTATGEGGMHQRKRRKRLLQQYSSSELEDTEERPAGGSLRGASGPQLARDSSRFMPMAAEVEGIAAQAIPCLANGAERRGGDDIGALNEGTNVGHPGLLGKEFDIGDTATAFELSRMEAVLSDPMLLLDDPLRAEELAAQVGLDRSQQLAARTAVHVFKALLSMTSSAVQQRRSSACGYGSCRLSSAQLPASHHGDRPTAADAVATAAAANASAAAVAAAGELSLHRMRRGDNPALQLQKQNRRRRQQQHQQQQHQQQVQEGEALPGVLVEKGGTGASGQNGAATRQEDMQHRARSECMGDVIARSFGCGPGDRGGGGKATAATTAAGSGGGGGGATGAMRLGHGNYRFSAVGRPCGLETSADGNPPVSGADAAAGAETIAVGAASPGLDLDASYVHLGINDLPQGPAAGSGNAANIDASSGLCRLRRGNRVKRPNKLLADMELEDAPRIFSRLQPHSRLQAHPHHITSPFAESLSPGRARLAETGGERGSGAVHARSQPPGHSGLRASRRGSGQEDDDEEEMEKEEGRRKEQQEDLGPENTGPGGQDRMEVVDEHCSGLPMPVATASLQQPSQRHPSSQQMHKNHRSAAVASEVDRWTVREAGPRHHHHHHHHHHRTVSMSRGRAVTSQGRPVSEVDEEDGEEHHRYGDDGADGTDVDMDAKRELQEDMQDDEAEEDDDGDTEEGEGREDSGGNGMSEMLAMQALFDLRAANAAPSVLGEQRQAAPVATQRQAAPGALPRLVMPIGAPCPALPVGAPRLAPQGLAAQQLLNVWQSPLWLGYALQPAMWW